MKKKKNMGIRILCALIFMGVCGSVMFAIYSLSAEDGQLSNARSEVVTEKIKEQVNTKLETTEEGERMIKQNIISSASTPWSFIFYTLYIKL